jgi:phage recombination protein Bet
MKEIAKIDHEKLITTLQNSLYVGAKRDSVEMVINYCQAAGLDPMQKPVHIVPMNTRDSTTGDYSWRDVIMPGIGLYRIQADRSKTLAGISEPEFGSDITVDFKDKNGNVVTVTYPEWCKIIMKKVVGDHIVEFVAKEYWIENYASAGKATAPNAMWKKRPRGQLAKCAEAQALRKGWPEIGQAPTAEEMEGKTIDTDSYEVSIESTEQTLLPIYTDKQFKEKIELWKARFKEGSSSPEHIIDMISAKYTLTEDQISEIKECE